MLGEQEIQNCFHLVEKVVWGKATRIFKSHGPGQVIPDSRFCKAEGTGEGNTKAVSNWALNLEDNFYWVGKE